MTTRIFCDRCRDEMLGAATLHITDAFGSRRVLLCERCSVSLMLWAENRPYSLLPDGAPAPIEDAA